MSPPSPLISVIVPNYNHAPYLRQRLDSIFGQTFQDFEVIILDDCSTDNSREIIDEYRHRPQVSHIVYNEENTGSPFKQWARGFGCAKGEFIWIAESDDWADVLFLERMAGFLQQDPSLALVFCESCWEYPNESIPQRIFPKTRKMRGIDFIRTRQIYYNHICNASAVLFRAKLLSAIPGDYQSYQGSGDYILWSQLCEHGNLAYVAEPLNHFRQHPANTTRNCIATGNSFLENFRIYQHFKKNGYISTFADYRVVEYELSQMELNRPSLEASGQYAQCRELWQNERPANGVLASLAFFFARRFNECANLPVPAAIWTFLHLPHTGLGEKIRRWRA